MKEWAGGVLLGEKSASDDNSARVLEYDWIIAENRESTKKYRRSRLDEFRVLQAEISSTLV